MTNYIILEKARPYTRFRRGKLEQVKGYASRLRQHVLLPIANLSEFKQVGPQLGSQPGGLFEEKTTGSKWYIKRPLTEEHAHNEKLTADLYHIAGVQVPRMKLINAESGLSIASEWIEGLNQSPEKVRAKPAGLADGFAVDAWLANWDVVGTAWDNILVDATNHAIRVDTGGGLKYRARGEAKPLDDKVKEWESLRFGHSPSKDVFGKLTANELINSGKKVMAITDDSIRRAVAENGFGRDLADLLIARKNTIASKVSNLVYSKPKQMPEDERFIEPIHLQNMVRMAIQEDPRRKGHGYTDEKGRARDTGWSAFFVVGDKVYTYREWDKIPVEDRQKAISFHSHSSSDSKEGEDFQPLNAADIDIWLKMFKKGAVGRMDGIIMADGRMEVLELTPNTKRELFSLGLKKLTKELHRDYDERSKYYEEHKNDPDYTSSKQDRELLRAFAKKYGITYHENLNWKPPEIKKGVTFYVVDLEKAKPYTRFRRGRLEHVKGYHGKDRKPVVIKIDPAWGKQAEEIQIAIDEWKKLRGDKERLAELGYEYVGKDKVVEKYYVASLGMKEEHETITDCDVLKHKTGSKIYVNAYDVPSHLGHDLIQWNDILELSKRFNPPDVFYRGGKVYGDIFNWIAPDGTPQTGSTAGIAQYDKNRIVVNDDYSGWWVDGHEMGHFVLNRLAKIHDVRTKEDEKFVESLGELQYVVSADDYDKGLKVLENLEISLDNKDEALNIIAHLCAWDRVWKDRKVSKTKKEVEKAYADQGLDPSTNGYGAIFTIKKRLEMGKPLELSSDERSNLEKYEKIIKRWKASQNIFTDWENIVREEPLKSNTDIDKYVNAKDRASQENFAEFYQLFTINLFGLPKHNAYEPAWEQLQILKENNPKKFQFFVDNVFPKEYKAFRKEALSRMKKASFVISGASHDL